VVKDQVLLSSDASADNNANELQKNDDERTFPQSRSEDGGEVWAGQCRQPEKDGSHWRIFR
jgi:hypothetical protein